MVLLKASLAPRNRTTTRYPFQRRCLVTPSKRGLCFRHASFPKFILNLDPSPSSRINFDNSSKIDKLAVQLEVSRTIETSKEASRIYSPFQRSDPIVYRSSSCEANMEDVTKTLEPLPFASPGTEELSLQKLTPDTFTCFPKLPLEMRRMIWKASLPSRQCINLDTFLFSAREQEDRSPFFATERNPTPPTALHISQESRAVALEHYTVMFNPWMTEQQIHMPLCIDPKVDLLHMSIWGMFVTPRDYPVALWSSARYTDCFRNIQNLEIRNFHWISDDPALYQGDLENCQFGFLNLCHGLKELHIVELDYKKFWYSPKFRSHPAKMEFCIRPMHQWYKSNAGTHPPQVLRSIPKIIPHDYRRIEARSDEENREFGRIPCSLDNEEAV